MRVIRMLPNNSNEGFSTANLNMFSIADSQKIVPLTTQSPQPYCQGTSKTGNVSCPSAHGAPMDLWNRCSRGWVPAECLEQKMLYAYTTVCTQGDFTLSRK